MVSTGASVSPASALCCNHGKPISVSCESTISAAVVKLFLGSRPSQYILFAGSCSRRSFISCAVQAPKGFGSSSPKKKPAPKKSSRDKTAPKPDRKEESGTKKVGAVEVPKAATKPDRKKDAVQELTKEEEAVVVLKGVTKPDQEEDGGREWREEDSKDAVSKIISKSDQNIAATKQDDDDSVPDAVKNRMVNRIVVSVAIPVLLGASFFPLYYFLKDVQNLDVPDWAPYVSAIACVGCAGFGIFYGFLSASWDPSREGSLWGWEEAEKNWPVFWDSFKTDKEKN